VYAFSIPPISNNSSLSFSSNSSPSSSPRGGGGRGGRGRRGTGIDSNVFIREEKEKNFFFFFCEDTEETTQSIFPNPLSHHTPHKFQSKKI
jgi:hypothetical protein